MLERGLRRGVVRYRSLPRAAQRRLTCQGVSCALLAGAALGAEAPGECLAWLGSFEHVAASQVDYFDFVTRLQADDFDTSFFL